MNYQEIIDLGIAYADRLSDSEVNANLDLFLRLGEARLSRLLKVRKASVRANITTDGSAFYALPPDYGGMRNIQINPSDPADRITIFDYMNPRQMDIQTQNDGANNQLAYYTIAADQIQLSLEPSGSTLEILYYQNIPPLSSGEPTNWVSDDHPDMYLSLLMYEIEIFVKNYESATGWETRLDKALKELEVIDATERWSGNPMATKVSVI